MKNIKLYFTLFLLFFIKPTAFSQKNTFAEIEIGSKGVKLSVIDVYNIKKGNIPVKSYCTEDAAIAKGISTDGNTTAENSNEATKIINTNYIKIKDGMEVLDSNIFIVSSSGVAMAKHTQLLTGKVKKATHKDLVFIDADLEGKMRLKGCTPPVDCQKSIILDSGGGNAKGGCVDVLDNNSFVFFSIHLNYGSVTFTENVLAPATSYDTDKFKSKSFGSFPIVREQVNVRCNSKSQDLDKEKIICGGCLGFLYPLQRSC